MQSGGIIPTTNPVNDGFLPVDSLRFLVSFPIVKGRIGSGEPGKKKSNGVF